MVRQSSKQQIPQGAKTSRGMSDRLEKLVLSFDDNRLVRDLMGDFHSHLAMIEDRLDIEIATRGNYMTLNGRAEQIDRGRNVLEYLYDRLENGEMISPGDVDGALRHVEYATLKVPPKRALGHAKPSCKNNKNTEAANRPAGHGMDITGRKLVIQTAHGLARIATRKAQITARSPMQSQYLHAIQGHDLTFGIGPAGTGKTYLAVAFAAASLERGLTDRIILSRPAVEAGERLGFLPGDLRDKIDPYLRPLFDALHDVIPAERVRKGLETGTIEIAPLAYMRGRTLAHSIIILDEAQNCTATQMKMFLTRLGEASKMIVTGDPSQIDLPAGEASGLSHAARLLKHIKGVALTRFSKADVVRHELVTQIIEAYEIEAYEGEEANAQHACKGHKG